MGVYRAIINNVKWEYSPPAGRKSLWCDGSSGAVQGECLLLGGIEGCSWCEVWHVRETRYYTQTVNLKQLSVACSECTFSVFCRCFNSILRLVTGNLKLRSVHKHTKAYCLLFFTCCGRNALRMASSIWLLIAKSCACVCRIPSICFLCAGGL
jgi:hypothetical protein